MTSPSDLYDALLTAWNRCDSVAYAALFVESGHVVGFDGSEMDGPAEIESTLRQIFADHETAVYVGKIKQEVPVGVHVILVRAICGMVAAGGDELNPAVNAIQTLLAVRSGEAWKIAHFQNTPAQYHGRPDLAEALTDELEQLL